MGIGDTGVARSQFDVGCATGELLNAGNDQVIPGLQRQDCSLLLCPIHGLKTGQLGTTIHPGCRGRKSVGNDRGGPFTAGIQLVNNLLIGPVCQCHGALP